MIKRRIPIVLIIGLAITLIIVLFKYRSLSEELNWQQTNVNIVFTNNLKSAARSLGDNPITADKNENYNYNHAISQISSAFQLFQFTTYKNDNNGLLEPLDNLCNLMKRDEYKGIIMQKSNLIRDELAQLSNHPEDKQATGNLNKLVEVIRQTNLLEGCVNDDQ